MVRDKCIQYLVYISVERNGDMGRYDELIEKGV